MIGAAGDGVVDEDGMAVVELDGVGWCKVRGELSKEVAGLD